MTVFTLPIEHEEDTFVVDAENEYKVSDFVVNFESDGLSDVPNKWKPKVKVPSVSSSLRFHFVD